MEEWKKDARRDVAMTNIDALVPQDHLLRKIERVMDYDWLYEAFLREARKRIAENGGEFIEALEKSPHLTLEENAKLSRVPNGYPQNHPMAEYLKLKDYSITLTLPPELLFGNRLVQNVAEYFREAMPFNHYLNSIGEELLFY